MWFLGVLRGCTLKTSFAGLSFPPAFCDRTITTHPCPCLRFCSQGTQPRERLSPCHRVDPSPSRILRRGNVGTITPLPRPVTPTLGHKGGANHLQREAWLGAGSLQSGTRGFCRYCGPPFVSLQFSVGLGRWWRGLGSTHQKLPTPAQSWNCPRAATLADSPSADSGSISSVSVVKCHRNGV